VSGYSGNAGDGLSYHNGMKFSSYDRDNDPWSTRHPIYKNNCAVYYGGGFWYKSCAAARITSVGGDFAWNVLPGSNQLQRCRLWLTCR